MRTVVDCVSSFILSYQQSTEYEIVLGRKNVAVKLIITFDKKELFSFVWDYRITYIIRQIEKRCKIARLPDGNIYSIRQSYVNISLVLIILQIL